MRDAFGRSSGSRLAMALAALALIVLCLVPTPPGSRAQEGQGSSGKLSGDGLELQWWLFGAETGPRSFADRTWQANGKITGKTVRFAGVMRLSVPKGMYTNGSMVAYISYPWSTGKQEKNWSGELSDEKGLKRTLTFDFTLDATIGKPIVVSASASKTGGATDLFAVYFTFAPPPAATPTATPTVAPVADQPTSVDAVAAALTAIAAILSGLVAALGALLTTSLSGLDVQDVLNALSDLIRGKPPAEGDQDESAKGEHDESAKGKQAQQLVDLAAALGKAAQQLKADGKYIANGSMIDKAINNPPHIAKVMVAWLGDLLEDLPKGPSDPRADAIEHELVGTPLNDTPHPKLVADPNWGQCGRAAEWGAKAMEGPIREIFGPDAVFTKIELDSNLNPLGNHIANKVIAPNGERYVVDMWATMVEGKPKIYTEAEWIETWKSKPWIGESVTVSRGELNSNQESDLEEAIRTHGLERGIKFFRLEYKSHPGQAETVINSYRAHPWRIELADQTDAAHPAPPNLPDPTHPPEKFARGWWIRGGNEAKPVTPPTAPETIWRGKLK